MPQDITESDHEISGHNGNDDPTYMEFLRQVVSFPDEDTSVPGENSLALKEAKKNTDERYHPALEIMLNYKSPNSAFVDFKKITPAVRAGHAIIRPDLEAFTENFLFKWLQSGLWSVSRNIPAQANDNKIQCSEDMTDLKFEKDPETSTIMRRIARIRLYYWYEKELEKMQEISLELTRGVDPRTRTIDAILEYFFLDWNTINKDVKEKRRSQFHNEKKAGKRWCELVQYLGEGILVICGKEMDTQMYQSSHMSYRG